MALNVTINGFCFHNDSSLSNSDVKYQMFFYRNGTASSADKWNIVRTVENTGYFSANLGDADWLGQDGLVVNNSKIVLVFWSGNPLLDDRNSNCSILTEWGAAEITINGSSVYTLNTQIKINSYPNLYWTLPTTGFVDTLYSTTNTSTDIYQWIFGSTTMYHWYQRYGQTINWINQIDNTSYRWGDATYNLNLLGSSIGTHLWDDAGNYDVDIVLEDKCGAVVSGTKQIKIFYHPPIPNIIMIPSDPNPNEVITFKYSGLDIDDTISSISWTIHDSGVYGNTDTIDYLTLRDESAVHENGLGTSWCGQTNSNKAFSNPGDHLVEIVINWFDGFDTQIINYNKTFTQNKFSGPTVDFIQSPALTTIASGVKFNNMSTNIDRVGLGLPNCVEYDWRFTDDDIYTDYLDKPYSYELVTIPQSINCQTRLIANWNDGWENRQTSITKRVVFKTTIVVTEFDCYHDLKIYGTSSDGTITGYSWTISSGISNSGPWVEVWNSPIGLDQQEKNVYFCTISWYKIEGFVYGSGATTSDYSILYISEACPGTDAVYNIWNGTGVLDIGTDWDYTGDGVEVPYAKYNGTNGLNADLYNGNKLKFGKHDYLSIDIQNYDYLTMMLNIVSWQNNKDIEIKLTKTGGNPGDTLNFTDYIDLDNIGGWQKIFIPLVDFNIPASLLPGHPIYANYLEFKSGGNIHFYLDDIKFSMGTMIPVPICAPTMVSDAQGQISMTGQELKPSMIASNPRIAQGEVVLRPFPRPRF